MKTKQFKLLCSFLWTISSVLGLSTLNDFGSGIEYDGAGLPTKIPIEFVSDFVASDPPGVGDVYFTVDPISSGDSFYTDISTTIVSNTELTVDLTRSSTNPPTGITVVTIDVIMWQKNTEEINIEMHKRSFSVTVTVTASESSHSLSTSGITTTNFSAGTSTTTGTGTAPSTLPSDLALTATGSVAFPNPIVVTAATSDSNYKVWFDNSAPVEVKNAEGVLLYMWPTDLVSATTSEAGSSNSLDITLNSVPVGVYNLGTIYVHCQVYYKDVGQGRRTLRGDFDSNGDRVEFGENFTEMISPVSVIPLDASSSSRIGAATFSMLSIAVVAFLL